MNAGILGIQSYCCAEVKFVTNTVNDNLENILPYIK